MHHEEFDAQSACDMFGHVTLIAWALAEAAIANAAPSTVSQCMGELVEGNE